jgi:hypothetical protein
MKEYKFLTVFLFLAMESSMPAAWAASGNATGPTAMALGGVVASYSPLLSPSDRNAVAQLFDGKIIDFPADRKISITSESVNCRMSNVDIISRTCNLAFGAQKPSLSGRQASELFATLVAAGVPSEGAAGTIYETITKLDCTIDPNKIRKKDGGGAQCVFETGE